MFARVRSGDPRRFGGSPRPGQVGQAQLCGASECFTFDRDSSGGKLALVARASIRGLPPARAAAW
jgi:hypothetical protein